MKITDPAHAVRVLEALTNSKLSLASNFAEPPEAGKMILALVEGTKAVLKTYKKLDEDSPDPSGPDIPTGQRLGAEEMVMVLAQAYAPRMEEAGMEVPE